MFSSFLTQEWLTNSSIAPVAHGGGDNDADGGLVVLIDSLLDLVNHGLERGSSWNPVAGIEALGSNIHPFIVHFPIAFLAGFLLLEVIGLSFRSATVRQVASGMLYFGAIGALAAVAAGLIAAESVPHGAEVHDILEWHERLGLTVAALSVALALWRAVVGMRFSAMAQALHLLVAGIVGVCLFFAADLGGLMVYQYGVGVKSLQQADDHHTAKHSHVHHDEDLEVEN